MYIFLRYQIDLTNFHHILGIDLTNCTVKGLTSNFCFFWKNVASPTLPVNFSSKCSKKNYSPLLNFTLQCSRLYGYSHLMEWGSLYSSMDPYPGEYIPVYPYLIFWIKKKISKPSHTCPVSEDRVKLSSPNTST